jgi:2-C-methyl-D-erythritol 2,4-cyclodiphosphate synthase
VADALLGATGLGDIGQHFPPTDSKWKDANSLDLLKRVAAMALERGGVVQNVDVTVVAEEPRIGPRAAEIKALLAAALAVEPERVSIKATTNEGVGPEGRGEAISAMAVCLVAFTRA